MWALLAFASQSNSYRSIFIIHKSKQRLKTVLLFIFDYLLAGGWWFSLDNSLWFKCSLTTQKATRQQPHILQLKVKTEQWSRFSIYQWRISLVSFVENSCLLWINDNIFFFLKKKGVFTLSTFKLHSHVLTCLNISNYKGSEMLTSLFLNIF